MDGVVKPMLPRGLAMKIICANHTASNELQATWAGQEASLDWLQGLATKPIEVVLPLPRPDVGLADILRTSLGSPALSPRALDCLGVDAFKFAAPLSIAQGHTYSLGFCWGTKTFLAMNGMKPQLPLRMKVDAGPVRGRLFQSSSGFAVQLKGDFFMSTEMWEQIEAAGITGLAAVGEYDILGP